MKKIMLTLVIVTTFGASAWANPPSNEGIRYITYQRNQIPNIITAPGIVSEIIFEDDEVIEYSAFGFSDAWEMHVVRDHILVFKAKEEQPETNLIVHTNKRDYLFTVTTGKNDWEKDPHNSLANFSVRMRYNDSVSKQAIAKEERKKEEEERKEKLVLDEMSLSKATRNVNCNYEYRASQYAGNIIPKRMWDNGTLTFISFAKGSRRGVIYELDHNRKAHLLNVHSEKNGLVVLHGIYPKLLIRLGDEVVEIRRNHSQGADGGRVENYDKTNVENTWRKVKIRE